MSDLGFEHIFFCVVLQLVGRFIVPSGAFVSFGLSGIGVNSGESQISDNDRFFFIPGEYNSLFAHASFGRRDSREMKKKKSSGIA